MVYVGEYTKLTINFPFISFYKIIVSVDVRFEPVREKCTGFFLSISFCHIMRV